MGNVAVHRPGSGNLRPGTECWAAFSGSRRLLTGAPTAVVAAVRQVVVESPQARILVFNDGTGETVEWDQRGGEGMQGLQNSDGGEIGKGAVAGGSAVGVARGPGRPRLGVVAREVTLLPRHWEWLAEQSGGASVALRKLVEQARRSGRSEEERRRAREAAYRFMAVAAGDEPGFEEAIRALFAGHRERFEAELAAWPLDLREYACRMASASFAARDGVESVPTGVLATP